MINCNYKVQSPCLECKERRAACWDRCERYIKYKAELQKGKDFLKGRKNPAYEEYAISKMHKALQRRKQTGR